MASKTSLDEKLSDLAGQFKIDFSDRVNLKYNFLLDQNYNQFNYNEIGTTLDLNNMKLDLSYLIEDKHIGDWSISTG